MKKAKKLSITLITIISLVLLFTPINAKAFMYIDENGNQVFGEDPFINGNQNNNQGSSANDPTTGNNQDPTGNVPDPTSSNDPTNNNPDPTTAGQNNTDPNAATRNPDPNNNTAPANVAAPSSNSTTNENSSTQNANEVPASNPEEISTEQAPVETQAVITSSVQPSTDETEAPKDKKVEEKVENEHLSSLTEKVAEIWESIGDEGRLIVKIGGGLIAADVVFTEIRLGIKKAKKKKKLKNEAKKEKSSKKSNNDIEPDDFEKPDFDFEPKNILTCLRDKPSNKELEEMFSKKKFISETMATFKCLDELPELLDDADCDAVILDIDSVEELGEFKTFLDKLKEEKDDRAFALLIEDDILPQIKDELNALKKDKTISGFVKESASKESKLINLVLPLYKPEINGENALEVVGGVADALGIPYISDIIEVSLSGKEIIETVKEGDMDAYDKASVIGEIANILGLDTVADVSDLIGGIKSVKDVTHSEKLEVHKDESKED